MKRPTDNILPHSRWETVQAVVAATLCFAGIGVLLAL